MTVSFVKHDNQGQILFVGSIPASMLELQGNDVMEVEQGISSLTHYVDMTTKTVKKIPEKPSRFHVWNSAEHCWEEDQVAIKAYKIAEIEAERDRRIIEPIIYDGKRVDADSRAQSNIRLKLASMERAPDDVDQSMLIWRDADNVNHVFVNKTEYLSWLSGLVFAIDVRATAAYQWSWDRKAELN